jgi:hypothetical protein
MRAARVQAWQSLKAHHSAGSRTDATAPRDIGRKSLRRAWKEMESEQRPSKSHDETRRVNHKDTKFTKERKSKRRQAGDASDRIVFVFVNFVPLWFASSSKRPCR